MGDQLLINGRHRLDVERERRELEDNVRDISGQLQTLRNMDVEMAEVRRLRQDEERLEREYYEKMDEADRFDREAAQLEVEAAQLEVEAAQLEREGRASAW